MTAPEFVAWVAGLQTSEDAPDRSDADLCMMHDEIIAAARMVEPELAR